MQNSSKPQRTGKNYLVLIGVENYSEWPELSKLKSPLADVCFVGDYLTSAFVFDNIRQIPSKYASANCIGSVLGQLENELTEEDSLIIYFSGHGGKKGKGRAAESFWYGNNAEENRPQTWFAHTTLKAILSEFPAKHVLVISDACYSGAMGQKLGGPSGRDTDLYTEKYEDRSRWVLSSGGDCPVDDKTDDEQNSVFASALVGVLRKHSGRRFVALSDLYNELSDVVLKMSRGRQKPKYFELFGTSEEDKIFGGELLLFNRQWQENQQLQNMENFDQLFDKYLECFIGRQNIVDDFRSFVANPVIPSGYYLVTADPGYGKTALSAYIAKNHADAWHFFGNSDPLRSKQLIHENLFRQLAEKFEFEQEEIEAMLESNNPFVAALNEISRRNEQCVIVVDGLDEADSSDLISPFFPDLLPSGIFFWLTSRRIPDGKGLTLPVGTVPEVLTNNDPANLSDISEYLRQMIGDGSQFQPFARKNDLSLEELKELLLQKADGNFMYLTLVLPAMAGQNKYLKIETLNEIPDDLKHYYWKNWQAMKTDLEDNWFDGALPVLAVMAISIVPKSIGDIMRVSGVDDRHLVRRVIDSWAGVIHSLIDEGETVFRLYHETFREFLHEMDQVADERFLLAERRKKFGDSQYELVKTYFEDS